jgi:thiol-disulfide isomerase/thioredoxin
MNNKPLPLSARAFGWVALFFWTAMALHLTSRAAMSQVTAKQALALKPLQHADLDYTVPTAAEAGSCTVESPKSKQTSGWIVKDAEGRLLRRFLDTNGDNDIDLWCYYKNGFEVYRDIDNDFDRKADQYRWYGSQGTRWGQDDDQDGVIDSWNQISAEEVSAEVVMALKNNDNNRFHRLLMTENEMREAGFGPDRIKAIIENREKSKQAFKALAEKNKTTLPTAKWLHFGGLRPGIIPRDTDGATKDILIYENVAALLRANGEDFQISLGTMVHTNNCWRMIDAPEIVDEKSTTSLASWYRPGELDAMTPLTGTNDSSEYQGLLAQFESLDKKLSNAATAREKTTILDQMVKTITTLALTAQDPDESFNWCRQFADSITAAFQSGDYPVGLTRLKAFSETLLKENKAKKSIALVRYRFINADFGEKLNEENVDIGKAQSDWLQALEKFTTDFPSDDNTSDAMMQLAMADEFDGQPEDAQNWYQSVLTRFPGSQYALKAKGAIGRLNSIGQKMKLTGETLSESTFDIGKYRGKVVVVHYWADWCEICKQEFSVLEKIKSKYKDVVLVGVNCDTDFQTGKKSAQRTGVSWIQLHSKGGFNGGLAAQMGIVSLPSMVLVDKDGRIVSTTLSSASLESEISSLLK